MKQWYTLHTKPKSEYQVAQVLQQRGIQTYVPQIEVVDARSKKRKKNPFFPCYIFSNIDLTTVSISQVQWTPGLRNFVNFGQHPIPVPDDVINLIRRKLDKLATDGGWSNHPFKPGDTVRIIDGPFCNMLAVFDGMTTPNERVQVLLDILGHASRVQVNVTDLEAVPAGAEAPLPKRPRRTRGRGRRIKSYI